jgi:hypothetical protein
MFCRYCGAHIADDSLFCAKCGKRLGRAVYPRLEKIVATFRLKTPYPYFGLLLILFVVWIISTRRAHADYSHVKLSIELEKNVDVPRNNLYHQNLSVVLENTGSTPVHDIPVGINARIEPQKPAEVDVDYRALRLVIMHNGKPTTPFELILDGTVPPGVKRRYNIGGNIQAETPFKVTYEVLQQDSDVVLASYGVER